MKNIQLNPFQKTFYFEWKINPSRTDYHMVLDQILEGNLDITRLNDALKRIIYGYYLFNSHIEEKYGKYYWVQNSNIIDLKYDENKSSLWDIKEFIEEPFDLEKGPLYRFGLFKINEKKYRFIYIKNHILIDGASTFQIYSEISKHYNCEKYSNEISLVEQIKKINNLNHDFKTELNLHKEKCIDFWKTKLLSCETLDISFLKDPRVKNKEYLNDKKSIQECFGIKEIQFYLDSEVFFKLNKIKKKYVTTSYLISKIIFAITIFKYTKQNSFCIAYPIAIKEGIDPIYAANVNINVLPFNFSDNMTIEDVFLQVKSFFKSLKEDKIRYNYFPFYEIISITKRELNKVTFSSANFQNILLEFDGIQSSICKNSNIALTNDFIFEVETTSQGVHFRVNYKNDLISEELITNFCKNYQHIYFQIIEDLYDCESRNLLKEIQNYNILTKEDYNKIIYDWNYTNKKTVSKKTIPQLFEEQVKKTPFNIALVCGNKSFTYQELNKKSNKLAHFLMENFDIKNDTLVGLCFGRNEHMLVAILATLKSGCAYVPIDPEFPKERIQFISNEINAKLLLTNKVYEEKLLSYMSTKNHDENCINSENFFQKIKIISIDSFEIQQNLSLQKDSNLLINIKENNLAYVIFTSGTTGKPKGVLIEHKGVVNLANETGKTISSYLNSKYINTLMFANYVFDAHVWEISSSIFHGHCLHLISDDIRKDIYLLEDYIRINNIHLAILPPAILNLDVLLELDILVVGGDKTNKEIIDFYLKKGIHVLNAYGPTEVTVEMSIYGYNSPEESYIIGKPIANNKSYVLDNRLTPMPLGAIGELYIGGRNLARGYLNRKDLTSERFLKNPFYSENNNEIESDSYLYKTGDLARFLADGNIEYIGRNDFQVKIRGFRIELGEIESVLLGFKGITQVTVIAKEIKIENHYYPQNKILICYYTSYEEILEESILDYLSSKLPDYMKPSYLIKINEFPLNRSGKVDINSLPDPEIKKKSGNLVLAKNNLEKNLGTIWEEVMGLPKDSIGIHDDFFSLGGDSIISIQIVARLRHRYGINLNVKDIFKYKNIGKISKFLSNESLINNGNHYVIKSEQGKLIGTSQLLPIQKWFFENNFLNINHWNQSFLIKTPKLDKNRLQNAIKKLVEYHDSFRFYYQENGNERIQIYSSEDEIIKLKLLNIRTLIEKEGENGFLTKLNEIFTSWQNQFVLDRAPLYSFGYVEGYDDGSARIFVALHHLLVDAVSWRIITEDLQSLYNGQVLAPKGTSYRQWAEVIRNYRIINNEEKSYWESIILNIQKDSFLQNESLNNFVVSNRERNRAEFKISKYLTQKLLNDCHKAYKTQMNDFLLASFSLALSKLTGRSVHDILIEGHGREEIEQKIDVTKTVGWFTTMYPFRLEVGNNLSNQIILIKEKLRKIPCNGIGYGSFYGYHIKELPKISFNYLGKFDNIQENLVDIKNDVWKISADESGNSIHTLNLDYNFLSVNCCIINESIFFILNAKFSKENLEKFSKYFKESLEEIIKYTIHLDRGYLTSSDVEYIINQKYLDVLQKDKEIENIYAANSLQQGFVYHSIKQGKNDDAYIEQIVWEYENIIEEKKLKLAWECAIQKYECLRMRFSWEDEIIQIIDKEAKLQWNYFDLSNDYDENNEINFINVLQKKDRENRYNLAEGNLSRLYLIKKSEDKYFCLFSSHHAIIDGWSNSILLNYVHSIYLNLLDNKTFQVERDFSYRDVQKYLSENKNKNLDYWNNYVSQIEDKLDLRGLLSDQARANGLSYNEHSLIQTSRESGFSIKGNMYLSLKKFCQNNSVTLNALLQFIWHKALSIYGNSEQTTVGITVSGRNLPVDGIENAVGLFINSLPLIVCHENNGNKLVIDCIKEIQDKINEINSRSNVNLAEIQKNEGRLFDNLFVFENYPTVVPKEFENRISIHVRMQDIIEKIDYPLCVIVYEQKDSLYFKVKYAEELFNRKAIENLLATVKEILVQINNSPNIMVNSLSYLSKESYGKIINNWNYSDSIDSCDMKVIDIFEERIKIFENNIALIYKDRRISYLTLNENANKLANYLKENFELDSSPFLAICLNRSELMIISILAILKLSKAYIPIDPKCSNEHIQLILEDAKPSFVLTDIIDTSFIENIYPSKVICIKSKKSNEHINNQKKYNPSRSLINDELSYVIYTSESKGNPKGVMVGHESCLFRILKMIKINKMTQEDSFMFNTSIISNSFFSDIFITLLLGAKLYITENDFNIDEIRSLIKENKITITHFLSSQLKIFLEKLSLNDFKSLNKIMISGELIEEKLINQYLKNGKIFFNYFESTETGVISVKIYSFDMDKLDMNSNRSTLGKAFEQTKMYVLDKNLKPMPIYAVGELYIGGIGIAKGYLNKQQINIEKFIFNPFQSAYEKKKGINKKIYKTGNLVRWLENGDLEYVGQDDAQIKFCGFRIDLCEIENAVLGFKNMKQVVIIIKELENNLNNYNLNKIIVCYYVSSYEINKKEITDYLSTRVPDYMIPSVFIYLSNVPLKRSGEIDKKALPEPIFKGKINYSEPKKDFENVICAIWEETLGLPKESVGIHDEFFRLGGNSITAIKVINQMNRKLGLNFVLQDVLIYRNINNILNSKDIERSNNIKIEKISNIPSEGQVLSFSQERLWFIEKLSEGIRSYHIPMLYHLVPKVNLMSLSKAFQKIISRHEILRTIIKETEQGITYQSVLSEEEYLFQINKFLCKSKMNFENILKQEINHTFDLSKEIPIKVSLYVFMDINGKEEKYLNINVHHIAFDGWSVEILLKEIFAFYQFYENKIDVMQLNEKIPFLNIQYKDFAYWQRDYLKNDKILESQLEYWKSNLKGFEVLNLHPDNSRPLQIDYQGKNIYFQIDESLSNELRALAKELNVSLYSLFLSAYYLMLSCLSGQKDIVVGSPISNRHYNQISNLIGLFVNTFALRTVIDPEMSLIQFIKSIGNKVIEAQKYQDLPFEKLVEEMEPIRDQSKHPLFQVLFSTQGLNVNNIESDFSNLFYDLQDCNKMINDLYSPAKFDLSLFIDDTANNFLGCFNYSLSLFREETINNYLTIYKKILKELSLINSGLINDKFELKKINYMPSEHFEIITSNWKSPNNLLKNTTTITKIFEEQVKKTPFNIAIVSDENKLTYSELNQRANQLANYLKETFTIKPDTFIALCLTRDENMLISILAVLKAGGAYVPIDPDFPKERMEYILQDTNAKFLIANEIYKDMLESIRINHINSLGILENNFKLILLDNKEVEYKIFKQNNNNLVSQIQGHHLAYIIYTSGTTGHPKGVLVEHKSVVNLIGSQGKFISREFSNKFIKCLWFSNYVFDAHVWELSASIFHGHCLYILNNDIRKDIHLLSKYIGENNIQVAMLPPSILDMEYLLDIELLIVAGDRINKKILNTYIKKNTKVVNAYGPTETTAICYMHKYKSYEEANCIGSLIENDSGYVLDSCLNLLPIGAVGELYIGGIGVCRGYLNKNDLTSERFLNNPFQTEEEKSAGLNRCLYKTGDLVKILPSGKLEYIGRNDTQVKIRGFRIELGEIESALLGFLGMKQTFVIVKEGEHKTLLCYYVSEREIIESELVQYLSDKLPEYMIPSFFIRLEELPLNVNGKIDKNALPIPDMQNKDYFIAPRNELEKTICSIWEEVLGLPKDSVGISDDFFKLGGDSILSIQIVGRIRHKTGITLRVKDIFKYKCISKILEFIETNSQNHIINEHEKFYGNVPLLPIQKCFFANDFINSERWSLSLSIKTPEIDFEKLKRSIHQLIEHHDSLRLRYKKIKNKWEQYYDFNDHYDDIKYYDLDFVAVKEENKEFNNIIDGLCSRWHDYDSLAKAPLYTFGYIKGFQDKSARIIIAIHHLLVDYVSLRIIAADLQSLYENKNLGKKGACYRQWVQNLKGNASNYFYEKELWNEIISNVRMINLNLNNKYAKNISSYNARNKTKICLNQSITQKLLINCLKEFNTPIYDILLSSFCSALKKLTGYSSHSFLLEGNGREGNDNNYDFTKTVGCFTSKYPICFKISDDIDELIDEVKENLRNIPNKGFGFCSLYSCQPDELPNISFNYVEKFESEYFQLNNKNNHWQIVNEESYFQNLKNNLISVNANIIDGCLVLIIETLLGKEITEKLASLFSKSVEEIIAHCTKLISSKNHAVSLSKRIVIESHDYQPLVPLNSAIQKPSLFMVHPARTGCEVYSDLAKAMSNDFHCYGVESFNIYHKNKIADLYDLSEYYLSKIQLKMDDCKQKTYHLFGWSLGGYIILEIASILEKKGVKDIFIYLLDSYCYDEYLINNKINLDVFIKYMESEYINEDFDKVIENYEIENGLLDQKISSTLKYSKILLFKAMKNKGNYKNKELENYLEYMTNLSENNVSNILSNKNHFKIIKADNASHLTIIQEEYLIINEMKKFIKEDALGFL